MKDLDYSKIVRLHEGYPHVLFFQQQGKYKDISIVKDIYDHCKNKVSIFEPFLFMESQFNYCRDIKHVFSNCWLDDSFFPGVERINSIEQVDTLRDGVLFIHDLERLFNSRGSLTDKDMNVLVDMVNNARKHRIMIRGSCHREMSIDVKLRSLACLWVSPEPYPVGDYWIMNDYRIILTVFNNWSVKPIGVLPLNDLYAYADLYDTVEESKALPRVSLPVGKLKSWNSYR